MKGIVNFSFAASLPILVVLSGCASLLNPKKQEVKIYNKSDKTAVYKDSVKIGEGDVKTSLVRNADDKQLVLKRGGYKPEHKVLGQHKNSPWKILSGLFVVPVVFDQGKKSKDFKDTYSFQKLSKIPQRKSQHKHIELNKVDVDIEEGDIKMDFFQAKDYLLDGSNWSWGSNFGMRPINYDDYDFKKPVVEVLKQTDFKDTGHQIVTPNNSLLYVNAKVESIKIGYVSERGFFANKYTDFVVYCSDIKWEVLNLYGENLYSLSNFACSGEIDDDFFEKYHHKALKDAVQTNFLEVIKKDTVQKLLQKDGPLKKEFSEELKLTYGKKPQNLTAAQKATVTIKSNKGHGSGCIVSNDGYILTNYHVVMEDSLEVITQEGKRFQPDLVRVNKSADLALLKIDKTFDQSFNLSEESTCETGETIYTVGTPSSEELGQSMTEGIISGKRSDENWDLIQIDASVSPGSTGGALVNEEGELIGIVNTKLMGKEVEGIGFSIPAENIRNFMAIN